MGEAKSISFDALRWLEEPALTPLAEEGRQRILQELGPLPLFNLSYAYWSLFLELLQSAEKMAHLYQKEKLTGPETNHPHWDVP